MQAKLEMETHQLADELDISRDKAAKLVKAEQTIEVCVVYMCLFVCFVFEICVV